MNNPPLKAVIIGCGGFALRYLGVYQKLPQVRPVLCYDLNRAAAERWAQTYGTEVTDDFEAVKAADADLAVVSTPNDLHLKHAGDLVASGKHVLVQKPLARTFEEAARLRTVVAAHPDRQLGLYMSMLDFEMWWELRAALQQREVFGQVVEMNIRLGHTGGLFWKAGDPSTWRLNKERTGGGAFIMLGVHYLHLMRWLTGHGVAKVCARALNRHCPQVEGEDICLVQGELTDGTLFQLCTAWNSEGEHFALYGTRGTFVYLDNQMVRLHADTAWQTRQFTYDPAAKWATYACVAPPALDDATNSFNQHARFAQAVLEGVAPPVTLNDGLHDMRVVDAVYRSAASGTWEVVHEY